LFSMTTEAPQISASLTASIRPMTSVEPPGGKGTTSLMVEPGVGQTGVWADAAMGRKAAAAASMARRRSRSFARMAVVMAVVMAASPGLGSRRRSAGSVPEAIRRLMPGLRQRLL